MSGVQPLADRYAEALLAVAAEQGVQERVADDLLLIDECISGDRKLIGWLASPSMDGEHRRRILETAFGTMVHEVTRRLLRLLVRRGRIMLLTVMSDAYRRAGDARKQVTAVTVTSARPLNEQQRGGVEEKVKQRFGTSTIVYSVDGSLIAGFRITTGEQEIDCSVRAGLVQLKHTLMQFG